MKKIIYIMFLSATLIISGCGDNFLEQKNLFQKYDIDYYKNPTDIGEALAGAYTCLSSAGGISNPTLINNLLSDDCFSGGGINDIAAHDIDGFTNSAPNLYRDLWITYYKGILRVNMLLKRFDQAAYTDIDQQNQDHGEAYFLRSYFYFTLAHFFKSVPLVIVPGPTNLPAAEVDELYAQIASDMKTAIELLPAKPYNSVLSGHATKWAAEGMMARIFLFYTGTFNKSELPLVGGGSITKSQVIAWLDDCIKNSGHELVPDFRNIWPYAYDTAEYAYAKNNKLAWIGDGSSNPETMFAIKYSTFGGWGDPQSIPYSNQLVLYMGLRGDGGFNPFGQGWGMGTVNPQLVSSFENGDIRKKGSIIDVDDPEEGDLTTPINSTTKYWNSNRDNLVHETGFWQKKYTPIVVTIGGALKGMYFQIYKNPDNFQLWNMQDEIILRFADVLLMSAELGSPDAQIYFDQIRSRAGLTSVPVTLENIKNERRHELAFEGLRYLDLLRWHQAKEAIESANDTPVKTAGADDVYNITFNEKSEGFLPIPESEISLQNDVLKQNPGW